MGYALDGSLVAIDIEMISLAREVPTVSLLGEEKWKAQTDSWRKQHKRTTVVHTRQTLGQAETWLGVPFMLVAAAINKGRQTTYSDAFIDVRTMQEYDNTEFDDLFAGDKEAIKEKGLEFLACEGA